MKMNLVKPLTAVYEVLVREATKPGTAATGAAWVEYHRRTFSQKAPDVDLKDQCDALLRPPVPANRMRMELWDDGLGGETIAVIAEVEVAGEWKKYATLVPGIDGCYEQARVDLTRPVTRFRFLREEEPAK